jgi:hypothetical protein
MSNPSDLGLTTDNDYASRRGQDSAIPVTKDSASLGEGVDSRTADSDAQLGTPSIITSIMTMY